MTRPPLRFGVVYDFCNPPDSGIATPRLYEEILEQVTWLDQIGLDLVWFITEHGITDLVTWAVPPGLHPQQMNASLERFTRDVVPRLRAGIESGPGEPLRT